jgi:hypothetical protein
VQLTAGALPMGERLASERRLISVIVPHLNDSAHLASCPDSQFPDAEGIFDLKCDHGQPNSNMEITR